MQLIKYDAACKAISELTNLDECKEFRDKADAIRGYARQAKNKQLEVDAAEIRMRAERKLGELIKQQKETVGLADGGDAAKARFQKGTELKPTLASVGIDKKLSSRAQKMAAVPEQKFESMLGEWRERVQQENERVTTNLLREGERVSRDEKLETPPPAVGTFDLIYADPPWRYEHAKTESRAIENHYPTLSLEEICALPIPASDDCVLFLWATSPKLAESIQVIEAWGFVYRTCAVWDKEKIGMGYYFRQQHELLLVATKGAPGTPEPQDRCSSVIKTPRGAHSAKPGIFYDLIESMYPRAAKLELFSRNTHDGWTAWGNQSNA